MSETGDQQGGRQQGVGKTGGLPGDHADPATRYPTDDELKDTVSMGEVSEPGEMEEARVAEDIDEVDQSAGTGRAEGTDGTDGPYRDQPPA
jgi:hypothetical protein